jgi:flagellar hook-basal body complex protein FliE
VIRGVGGVAAGAVPFDGISLGGVGSVGGAGELGGVGERSTSSGAGGFADALESAIRSVDASQHAADGKLQGLATGQAVDLHGTMIALEEANIALRAMGSVRDKVVEGWQTVWNMPI